MKTIADYQPDPLIRSAIDLIRSLASAREVNGDALLMVQAQVAYDIARDPFLAVRDGDIVAWVARAIAQD